jgi:hypothetical protein
MSKSKRSVSGSEVAAVCLVRLKIRHNTRANANAASPMMPMNFLLPA